MISSSGLELHDFWELVLPVSDARQKTRFRALVRDFDSVRGTHPTDNTQPFSFATAIQRRQQSTPSTVNSPKSTITDGATGIDMILSPKLPILAKCRTPALLSVKAGAGLKLILYI